MHGPAYAGDFVEALRDLAEAYDERLVADGARVQEPGILVDTKPDI
jgi:hypothetical protein